MLLEMSMRDREIKIYKNTVHPVRPPPFTLSAFSLPPSDFPPFCPVPTISSLYLLIFPLLPPIPHCSLPPSNFPCNFPHFIVPPPQSPDPFFLPYFPSFLYLFICSPTPFCPLSPILSSPPSTCSVVCYTDVGSSVPSRNPSYTDSNNNPHKQTKNNSCLKSKLM